MFSIACAKATIYASMATCRAFEFFFISPASAISSAVIVRTFFEKEKTKYIGTWSVMIMLSIPLALFIFGFIAYHAGYRWIYWIPAMEISSFVLWLSTSGGIVSRLQDGEAFQYEATSAEASLGELCRLPNEF